MLTAVEALREAGAEVVGVAVIVDRSTGAQEKVEAAGCDYLAAFGLDELGLPAVLRPRTGRAQSSRISSIFSAARARSTSRPIGMTEMATIASSMTSRLLRTNEIWPRK